MCPSDHDPAVGRSFVQLNLKQTRQDEGTRPWQIRPKLKSVRARMSDALQ